ncbi:hypothetical protein BJV77DRAFT_1050777 [Russula vinacea]|nr:hypothetical protein BJV77DRAFT_1054652 [Russula vinacea]KAH9978427.1 hypothetical protein BJV77DRAFT_1050777 [Russula vinacea]
MDLATRHRPSLDRVHVPDTPDTTPLYYAAPLTSPQSSPMPTATNGRTSPTPIPSLGGSESQSSCTPAPQSVPHRLLKQHLLA